MSFFKSLFSSPFGLSQGQNALNALQKSAIPQGMEATGRALGYDEALLSGDPTAEAAAIEPEMNASAAQTEQAKKQISSEGTARGGGINAALQKTADLPTKTAVDTITALQPGAAAATAGIGEGLTRAGESAAGTEVSNALQQHAQDLGATFDTLSMLKPSTPTGLPSGAPNPVPEEPAPIPSQIPQIPTDAEGYPTGGDTESALTSQFGGVP